MRDASRPDCVRAAASGRMDAREMVNLATLSAAALETLGPEELVNALDAMSPEAIDRFRSMRALPGGVASALGDYLEAHPHKLPGAPAARQHPSAVSDRPPLPAAMLGPRRPAWARTQAPPPKAAPAKPARKASTSAKPKPKPGTKPKPKTKPTPVPKADDGYVPFPERFKAWWYGTPLTPTGSSSPPTPPPKQGPAPSRGPQEIKRESPPEDAAAWRVRILQRVWGDGYVMPGRDAPILKMAELAGMEPTYAVADVTAGLGGPAASLEGAHQGITVDRYTWDAALLEAARKAGSGMPEPVLLDPKAPSFGGRRYDRIFARENLYLLPGREGLLRFFADNLRGGGEIVFWDLIDNDPSRTVQEVRDWRENEIATPHVLSMQDYTELLVAARLDLRAAKDMSRSYRKMVEPAFKALIASLETDPLPPAGVDALMAECELWRRRLAALATGDIRLVRFHAARRRIRTLSGPA